MGCSEADLDYTVDAFYTSDKVRKLVVEALSERLVPGVRIEDDPDQLAVRADDVLLEDTTEEVYGLGVRSYPSFLAASEEAAISRLYGGIHYRRAIEEGVKQGEAVGNYQVSKLKTLK